MEVVDEEFTKVDFVAKDGPLPKIVGFEGQFKKLFTASKSIIVLQFHYDPTLVFLTGLARVYEGNIQYEVKGKNDEVLKKGYIQARTGLPDWGYFNLELQVNLSKISGILLFTESAKDGTREGELFLPVKTPSRTEVR